MAVARLTSAGPRWVGPNGAQRLLTEAVNPVWAGAVLGSAWNAAWNAAWNMQLLERLATAAWRALVGSIAIDSFPFHGLVWLAGRIGVQLQGLHGQLRDVSCVRTDAT